MGGIIPAGARHYGAEVLINPGSAGDPNWGEYPPEASEQLAGHSAVIATCLFLVEYIAALDQMPDRIWETEGIRGYKTERDANGAITIDGSRSYDVLSYPPDTMT